MVDLEINSATSDTRHGSDTAVRRASGFRPGRPPTGPSQTLPTNQIVGRETVEIRRLDDLFDECMAGIPAQRLYLKIDTQGFDLEVLRGADGVLANFQGAQTEVSFVPIYHQMPKYFESLREFESRGFSVVDFMPVLRANKGPLMMEMDCILARNSEPV